MGTPTSIGKLPNELLQRVADYLGASDLMELSLVSRQLREIAQKVLYRSIELPFRDLEGLSRHLALLRTLLGRPDLCHNIRWLRVSADAVTFPVTDSDILTPSSRETLEDLVTTIFTSWKTQYSEQYPDWEDCLKENFECAYVGYLLTLLRNLKGLQLYLDAAAGETWEAHLEAYLCGIRDPSSIIVANLRTVTVLRIPIHHIPSISAWTPCLLSLQILDVDTSTIAECLSQPWPSVVSWKLQVLIIDLYAKAEKVDSGEDKRDLIDALKQFSAITHTQNIERLVISGMTWDDIENVRCADYDLPFQAVHAAWPGVKFLDVVEAEAMTATMTATSSPSNSDCSLTKLRRLSIPQRGLMWFDDDDPEYKYALNISCIAESLPEQLEHLQIFDADGFILGWLGNFVKDRGPSSRLTKIQIYLSATSSYKCPLQYFSDLQARCLEQNVVLTYEEQKHSGVRRSDETIGWEGGNLLSPLESPR